jgi:hypothetical protein
VPRRHISNIRSKSAFRRRPGQREPRSITLIVREGETEQAYFEAVRILFQLTTAEVVVADNTKGAAPISVVECAEERAAEQGGYRSWGRLSVPRRRQRLDSDYESP